MISFGVMTHNQTEEVAKTEKMCLEEGWNATQIESTVQNGGIYFVCEKDGKMAGHVGMSVVAGEGYITNMAIRPAFRRQGLGFGLMNHLLDWSKKHNLEFVSLEVRESNAQARSLYEKNGFCMVGQRKNFYEHPREDAIIMTHYFEKEM